MAITVKKRDPLTRMMDKTAFMKYLKSPEAKNRFLAIPFVLFSRANCQHSNVSIKSAGLNTFKFGIDLKPVNCSIG